MAFLSFVDLIFEWYEDAVVFRVLIFNFLYRNNGNKEHLDENNCRHCYGNFSKVPFRKLLDNGKFIINSYEPH